MAPPRKMAFPNVVEQPDRGLGIDLSDEVVLTVLTSSLRLDGLEETEEATFWYVRGANPNKRVGLLMVAAHLKSTPDAFSGAREQMRAMEEHLRSDAAFASDLAELERYVKEEGRELERRLLQAHLDLRAAHERPVEVCGADGVRRTARRQVSRVLVTLVGEVVVRRWAYEAKGVETLHPADAALNLPADQYSFGVRRLIAEEACRGSFDEVIAQTKKIIGVTIPKRQVEELTVRAAQDFTAFYATRAVEAEDTTALLVFGFNGKGVVMRHKDLREGTRKAAEKSRHKLETRLTQGEKRNRKRMAQVATIYTVDPWVRTPMDILHDLRSVRAVAARRPRLVNKRVWASLAEKPTKVIEDAFSDGLRRDPERKRQWVVVVDGNQEQLRQIKRAVKHAGGNVTIILDLIHVLEYLWKVAHCFHKAGSPALEEWVDQRLLALLQGRTAGALAKDLRRWAARRELDKDQKKVVTDCIRYLLNNRKLLHYDRALAAGLPIATGVVEGACRHLVGDRLDTTGPGWSLRGAEALLRLRALRSSGDFEEYWAFHLAREHARNHEARYMNKQVPGPLWPTESGLRSVK